MVQPRLGPSATISTDVGLVRILWCRQSVSLSNLNVLHMRPYTDEGLLLVEL